MKKYLEKIQNEIESKTSGNPDYRWFLIYLERDGFVYNKIWSHLYYDNREEGYELYIYELLNEYKGTMYRYLVILHCNNGKLEWFHLLKEWTY